MKKVVLSMRLVALTCLMAFCMTGFAHSGTELRRPISPEQPAWIIHIDVWQYADPQKIIDMVPEDVRPYVIFNISTSSSDDKSPNGPAIYDSWMKICAQNRVWTMIQCASGYFNRMPDTPDDVSAYEQYFKEYPNFLGFNFAEQYWGFDSDGHVTFDNRLRLFAKLLTMSHTYGGYLAVSFADSYYGANKMPIAYVKRNADINTFLTSDPDHFLCFEKYTQKKNFLFNESYCLGAWLSGITGQYGIRFDSSGWVEKGVQPDMQDGDTEYTIGASDFVRAAGAIPVAEHLMLTGQTMMDGPELTWTECSKEGNTTSVDGYTQRNWEWFPQFNNISLDLFRKVLDGTIRIMSKEEVMARTKVCVVSTGSGSDNASYRIDASLFDGLYRNEKDYGGLQGRDANNWLNNRWWMKSTGRYPTIPEMLAAGSLEDISGKLSSIETKQTYMNSLFPEEYTGTIFAGRQENGWVTYNPYQYDDVTANGIRTLSKATQRATGTIPFQYNTCTSVELDYAPYSLGIMKEYTDKVTFYLSNYQNGAKATDIIKINGASARPSYSKEERGSGTNTTVKESWENQVYTLTIEHNGPVDLTVNCAGTSTGRKTTYTTANVSAPAAPAAYTGALQYEAELADYKSVTIKKVGDATNLGQGYVEMGSTSSALRYHINIPEAGYYELILRYKADAAGETTLSTKDDSYVITTAQNNSWTETVMPVVLTKGEQVIDLINTGGKKTYVDCIKLEKKKIAPFNYDLNGEYHVDFNNITVTGDLTFDASTGVLTLPAGKTGSMLVLLDDADFTKVTNVTVTRTGDDIFQKLRISDLSNVAVNNNGAFWSSKYNLTYSSSYQEESASQHIYKLEWSAASSDAARTMTISDILIKVNLTDGVIDETKGVPAVIPADVTTKDITYTRLLEAPAGEGDLTVDFQPARLYTICLPYQPTTAEGLKYYTLNGVNGSELEFVEVETVAANTPYLVAVTDGSINIGTEEAISVDFNSTIVEGTPVGGYQLKGTLRGLTNAEAQGSYILQEGNIWNIVPANNGIVYIPPFRAYIVSTNSSKASLRSIIGEGTTGIRQIKTTDMDGTVKCYDLNGRYIGQPTHKGIYIVNGRKVIYK